MDQTIILASGSEIRATLLRQAGVRFVVETARVDEAAIRASLMADSARPRDIADSLAEAKARKIAGRHAHALVIGADQVLDLAGDIFSKPRDPDEALRQLQALRNKKHKLLSAAVIYEAGQPVWRHVSEVRLTMRDATDAYLQGYVARNWESIRHSVGAYKIEEEGVRLFSRIEGDHFAILGLPLIELLSYLTLRGTLPA